MIGAQFNVEGALIRGTAICEGAQVAAARIFCRLLNKTTVGAISVSSRSGNLHTPLATLAGRRLVPLVATLLTSSQKLEWLAPPVGAGEGAVGLHVALFPSLW